MSHPLEKKVLSIHRKIRWLKAVYALGWVASIFLIALTSLATLDFLFRYQDQGLRILSTATLTIVVIGALYHFVGAAIRNKLTQINVAQQIERQFPLLEGQLSSTIAFLSQDENDRLAGSSSLRRCVVNQTMSKASEVNFNDSIQWKPMQKLGMVIIALSVVISGLVYAQPSIAKLATIRLLAPLVEHPWPKVHHLVVENKQTRIAQGQAFEVEVTDTAASFPEEVFIHYRYYQPQSTNVEVEQELMRSLGDKMIARKENVTRDFEYRVTGGDDDSMPWIHVHVVQPPRIVSLQLNVTPPPYTGLPQMQVDSSFEAMIKSQVSVSAKVSKPLKRAILLLENGKTIEAKLGANKKSFSILSDSYSKWTIDQSRSYWFKLKDTEGLTIISPKWEIRPLPDSLPSVVVEKPAGTVYATNSAKLPLHVLVNDDLALANINLLYKISIAGKNSQQPYTAVNLYQGPKNAPKIAVNSANGPVSLEQILKNDRKEIQYEWDLNQLNINAGSSIDYYIHATDYRTEKDLTKESSKKQGRSSDEISTGTASPHMRIIILSSSQLESRLANQYRLVLGQLGTILKLQRSNHTKCIQTQNIISTQSKPTKELRDRLQALEINQRHLTRMLGSGPESASSQLQRLQEKLKINNALSLPLAKKNAQLLAELKLISEKHLLQTEHHLSIASKSIQVIDDLEIKNSGNSISPLLSRNLNIAIKHQQHIINTLAELLGELVKWDSFYQLRREVEEVQIQQQIMLTESEKIGQKTLGKSLRELSDQEKTTLEILANKQSQLADRFAKVNRRMEPLAQENREKDASSIAVLKKAIQYLKTHLIESEMKQAAENLKKNRIGQARQFQSQADQELLELLQILSGRTENKASANLAQLKRHTVQLQSLLDSQQQLRKEIESKEKAISAKEKSEFEDRQIKHLQQTAKLARQLRRLGAFDAAGTAQKAAEEMERFLAGMKKNAFSIEEAKRIEQSLKDALRQLRRHTQQEEGAQINSQLSELLKTVTLFAERQKEIIVETTNVEKNKNDLSRRSLLRRSQSIIKLQQELKDDIEKLASDNVKRPVVQLSLASAVHEMEEALLKLRSKKFDNQPMEPQQQALAYLQDILDSLKSKKDDIAQAPKKNDQPNNGNKNKKNLNELQLLKLLQVRLLKQTKQLEDEKRTSGLSDVQKRKYQRLATMQGKLIELFAKLLKISDETNQEK